VAVANGEIGGTAEPAVHPPEVLLMSRPLREITTYLVIVFSLAIAMAVALPHAGIGVLLSALLPLTTVLVITFTATPRGQRRSLWGSFGLNKSGKSAWAFALVVPVLLAGAAYGVAVVLDVAELRDWDPSQGLVSWTLNEEIGWRGYMLPRVQQLTSRRRAALITGFVHGCFHLPLILIATTYDEFGARWFVAPMVVAVLTMGGVFYAYLWDRTHSVWPVSMAHGSINIAFGWGAAAVVGSQTDLAYVAGESGAATLLVVGLVGVAFLARAKVWRVPAVDSAVAEDRRTVSV
jgi:membrane protease YdiL (CAAX protease family)